MSLNINHAKELKTLIRSGGLVISVGEEVFSLFKKMP